MLHTESQNLYAHIIHSMLLQILGILIRFIAIANLDFLHEGFAQGFKFLLNKLPI